MADYWKSQGRKFCDFCKCWIADNKPSIDFHEGGKKHKENVSKRLKEIHKNTAKQVKQHKKFEDDLKKMENAAMAAYLRDVENNTRDMTAERIIKEKQSKPEAKDIPQSVNHRPGSAPVPTPKFKSRTQFPQEVDPCDPLSHSKPSPSPCPRIHPPGESKAPGKTKASKGKGKGKRVQEDERRSKPIRKLWYEALSPEGYTYYWHTETNESVWEPPEEGYMTFAEQEQEAKEQAIQEELLKQLEEEEAIEKADILEEQRATAEREKLRQIRKAREEQRKTEDKEDEEEKEEEERPYRRDYSVPVKPQPYGSWETVKTIERKPIDLQLPQVKQIQLPSFEKAEPPPIQRSFKEKTITQITTADSDEEEAPTTFKKRKIGNKSVRKRMDND